MEMSRQQTIKHLIIVTHDLAASKPYMQLGPCVTTITCQAVYQNGKINRAWQSMELGGCVTTVICKAVYLTRRIHGDCQSMELGSYQRWKREGSNRVCVTEQLGFLENVSLNKFKKKYPIQRDFSRLFFVILCIVMQ